MVAWINIRGYLSSNNTYLVIVHENNKSRKQKIKIYNAVQSS